MALRVHRKDKATTVTLDPIGILCTGAASALGVGAFTELTVGRWLAVWAAVHLFSVRVTYIADAPDWLTKDDDDAQ